MLVLWAITMPYRHDSATWTTKITEMFSVYNHAQGYAQRDTHAQSNVAILAIKEQI